MFTSRNTMVIFTVSFLLRFARDNTIIFLLLAKSRELWKYVILHAFSIINILFKQKNTHTWKLKIPNIARFPLEYCSFLTLQYKRLIYIMYVIVIGINEYVCLFVFIEFSKLLNRISANQFGFYYSKNLPSSNPKNLLTTSKYLYPFYHILDIKKKYRKHNNNSGRIWVSWF